jgi:hypothetical protein
MAEKRRYVDGALLHDTTKLRLLARSRGHQGQSGLQKVEKRFQARLSTGTAYGH